MYGGKIAAILPAILFIKIAFKKLSTVCPSVRGQQPPKPKVRRLLNLLFENYTEKCGAILCFVKIDTSISRIKRRSLHVSGRIERLADYPAAC